MRHLDRGSLCQGDCLPSSNTCRIVAGRLMEVQLRGRAFASVADVDEMSALVAAGIASVDSSVRLVIAADWRACKILTPPVAERATEMMLRVNTRVERSAILHGTESSTSVLQLTRLIKETNAPWRRLFTDPQPMREWLAEVLNEQENARLREFLSSPRG